MWQEGPSDDLVPSCCWKCKLHLTSLAPLLPPSPGCHQFFSLDYCNRYLIDLPHLLLSHCDPVSTRQHRNLLKMYLISSVSASSDIMAPISSLSYSGTIDDSLVSPEESPDSGLLPNQPPSSIPSGLAYT